MIPRISGRRDMLSDLASDRSAISRLLSMLNAALWQWDFLSNRIWYSEELAQMLDIPMIEDDSIDVRDFIYSRIHPDDLDLLLEARDLIIEGLDPLPLECRLVFEGGLVRHILVDGDWSYDMFGQIVAMNGYIVDQSLTRVTEERLILSEMRYKALNRLTQMYDFEMDQILDYALETGIALTRSRIGYLYHYNESSRILTLYSWSPEVMKECAVASPLTQYELDRTGLWGEAIRQHRPIITNDYAAPSPLNKGLPEGHVPIIRHMNLPITDGGRIVGVFGVANKSDAYDETDVQHLQLLLDGVWSIIKRRDIEMKLLRSNEELEERVRLRTTELESARDRALQADRAKSEFLANISHEIRTPLNAIIGFSELVSGRIADPKLHSYLQSINVSGQSLLQLINDILDLSKIEAGMMTVLVEPTSVRELFSQLHQMFALRIAEKNLDFQVEIDGGLPPAMLLDEARLRQILVNIVGNAVKFTENGHIKLSARSYPVAGADSKVDLLLEIEDTGIGIPEAQQEAVFESFRQQDGQNTRKYGGTGLGLSISRKLVNMMNGEIKLVSEPGKGSRFTVLFRDVAVSESSYRETGLEGTALEVEFEPATILVVDDIEVNRVVVREMLEGSGLEVLEASSGKEAVRIAAENHPSLILMDLRMPDMDGYESAGLIRETSLDHQYILAFTASPRLEGVQSDHEGLFDGVISKPVTHRELLEKLAMFLPGKRREQPEGGCDVLESGFNLEDLEDRQGLADHIRTSIMPLIIDAEGAVKTRTIRNLIEELGVVEHKTGLVQLGVCRDELEQAVQAYDITRISMGIKVLKSIFIRIIGEGGDYSG